MWFYASSQHTTNPMLPRDRVLRAPHAQNFFFRWNLPNCAPRKREFDWSGVEWGRRWQRKFSFKSGRRWNDRSGTRLPRGAWPLLTSREQHCWPGSNIPYLNAPVRELLLIGGLWCDRNREIMRASRGMLMQLRFHYLDNWCNLAETV